MVAFVIGWMAVLTALINGVFLLSLRPVSGWRDRHRCRRWTEYSELDRR